MSPKKNPLLRHQVKSKSLEYTIEIVAIQDPFALKDRYLHQVTIVKPAKAAGTYISRIAYEKPSDLVDYDVAWLVSHLRRLTTLQGFIAGNLWQRLPDRIFTFQPSRATKGVYFIQTSLGVKQ